MSDEKNLRSLAAPSADSWVVRLTTHLPMSRPRSFFHSSDEWTPELVRATRFPTRQAASAFVEDKGLVTHDVAVLQLLPDGSLVEVPNLRSEAAARGDDTPETAPRGGDGKVADGEHTVAAVEFAVRALDEVLPGLRSEAAPLDQPEKPWHVIRTGQGVVRYLSSWDGSWATWTLWTPSPAGALSWATAGLARRVQDQLAAKFPGLQPQLRLQQGFPDEPLRSEAAPQQERAQDTWMVVMRGRAMPSLYLGEGEEEWWTRDEEQARQFDFPAASALVASLQGRPFASKLTIFRHAESPNSEEKDMKKNLRTECAPVVAHGAPLSASVDERGSLTVHLGTDDQGNVVSTMPEVRAAIEAASFRKMEPEEKDMKKDLRTEGANAPVREDGTTWLLWHKHDNSYLGRPGGFDEEGLATHFASQAEAEQFRDEHVSRRLVGVVVAVPRPKQKLCVEDVPTRPSEPSLRVVAAAVCQEGMIYSLPRPARHHNILHKLHDLRLPTAVGGPYSSLEQGFLLSDGTFVGRALAAAIAVTAGQVQKLTAPPELYSEDLW